MKNTVIIEVRGGFVHAVHASDKDSNRRKSVFS